MPAGAGAALASSPPFGGTASPRSPGWQAGTTGGSSVLGLLINHKGEKKKKKRAFYLFFKFRFFIQRQFSHTVIFIVTINHQAARKMPQMCTPGWDSPDHSWLSFSKAGQNPCHARFFLLTVDTGQGAGSGGEVSIAGESHNSHLNPASCREV